MRVSVRISSETMCEDCTASVKTAQPAYHAYHASGVAETCTLYPLLRRGCSCLLLSAPCDGVDPVPCVMPSQGTG